MKIYTRASKRFNNLDIPRNNSLIHEILIDPSSEDIMKLNFHRKIKFVYNVKLSKSLRRNWSEEKTLLWLSRRGWDRVRIIYGANYESSKQNKVHEAS